MPTSKKQVIKKAPKTLLVFGAKTFRITIPPDAKVTFGPFSPPSKAGYGQRDTLVGTLRVYQGTKDNIIGCFTQVSGFRDVSLAYEEEMPVSKGKVISPLEEEDKEIAKKELTRLVHSSNLIDAINGIADPEKLNQSACQQSVDEGNIFSLLNK